MLLQARRAFLMSIGTLQMGSMFRFNPAVMLLREFLDPVLARKRV